MKDKDIIYSIICLLYVLIISISLIICRENLELNSSDIMSTTTEIDNFTDEVEYSKWFYSVPEYRGTPYIEVNGDIPFFTDEDKRNTEAFEIYSDLDALGRCGVAYANISRELLSTEERGDIGSIKPSGWNQAKYEGVVDSSPPYLYNRCHLIAYCLTAENLNEKNLITGTRYLNVKGMLPFEEQVARYLDTHDNHVLYRVTPIFEGKNIVASGVLMEAYSVEDEGAGICFCVYCYNVQPGVKIDYRTGESWENENKIYDDCSTDVEEGRITYILNTNSKKFHTIDCSNVSKISDKNRKKYTGSRDELISQGYNPAGCCNP